MLEVKNIQTGYGDIQVLWNISFSVNKGDIVVILGANGSGKTTILKTISGIIPLWSGDILYDGKSIANLSSSARVDFGIIHVPEGRKLFSDMTVEENLIVGSLSHHAKPKRSKNLEWCYSLFPRLGERRKQMAGTLSGGEQQMCAIARGLMANPKILMLDEPSLGLAPIIVHSLFEILKEINREGVTILLVEQNVKQSLDISNKAYVIENGSVVKHDISENLTDDPTIKEAYLGI